MKFETEVVSISNVIFELYKAALSGEITQDDFEKLKCIVKRAKVYKQEIELETAIKPHTAPIE